MNRIAARVIQKIAAKSVRVKLWSDGSRDFVEFPDGRRYILGTLSVVQFLLDSSPSPQDVKRACDEFNEKSATEAWVIKDKALDLMTLPADRVRFY